MSKDQPENNDSEDVPKDAESANTGNTHTFYYKRGEMNQLPSWDITRRGTVCVIHCYS